MWSRSYWGFRRPTTYNVRTGSALLVHEYEEGQLAIDVFDGGRDEPAWHGTATKEIKFKDRKDPKPLIDAAVTEILQHFPPRNEAN